MTQLDLKDVASQLRNLHRNAIDRRGGERTPESVKERIRNPEYVAGQHCTIFCPAAFGDAQASHKASRIGDVQLTVDDRRRVYGRLSHAGGQDQSILGVSANEALESFNLPVSLAHREIDF